MATSRERVREPDPTGTPTPRLRTSSSGSDIKYPSGISRGASRCIAPHGQGHIPQDRVTIGRPASEAGLVRRDTQTDAVR
jgi:hypothetical protein